MTKTDPKKIAARIKALMAKTAENGATEEEALAAMQKARELMDKYGLTEAAIKADADTIATDSTKRRRYKTFVIKDRIATNVGRFCDCVVYRNTAVDGMFFHGTAQDRQFAIWLIEALDLFVRNQTEAFMAKRGYPGGKGPWELQKGFMNGCIERINERLKEEIAKRNQHKAGDGRSLVVIKMNLVNQDFERNGPKLRSSSTNRTMAGDGSTRAAGYAAGDRASFSRPVNGGAGVRAIGGR